MGVHGTYVLWVRGCSIPCQNYYHKAKVRYIFVCKSYNEGDREELG